MEDKKNGVNAPGQDTGKDKILDDRRKAVKGLLTGVGATAAGLGAAKWSKPAIDKVVLPAHAQTSATSFVLNGTITNNPITNNILDFFIQAGHAAVVQSPVEGGCISLSIADGVVDAEVTLNTSAKLMGQGLLGDGSLNPTDFKFKAGELTVSGSVDDALNPTTCNGFVDGVPFAASDNAACVVIPATTTGEPNGTDVPDG